MTPSIARSLCDSWASCTNKLTHWLTHSLTVGCWLMALHL